MNAVVEKVSEVSRSSDALLAVKLDPAVLEAKITVDRSTNITSSDQGLASIENEHQLTKKPKDNGSSKPVNFEELMRMQKAAVLTLTPRQYDLLLKYVDILRMQRHINQKSLECAFCKKNGEPASWYSIHMLRDRDGRVRCPVLRGYRCPGCGATGDKAHTIKYCPLTDRVRVGGRQWRRLAQDCDVWHKLREAYTQQCVESGCGSS